GFGGIELRACRVCGSLHFVVGRCRNEVRRNEAAVSQLVIRSLPRARLCGSDGLLLRSRGEPEVRGIDTHERLAALDGLTGIDQTSQDLPGTSEAEVALHLGRDDAAE